ncbi:MAG: hypothetical protein ABR998_08825 [Gemmatimonadales bacterium]|jgi:hypothetical protein
MLDDLTRRDWVKLVGAAGAGSLIAPKMGAAPRHDPAILPLTSTSEVFVPGRGRTFQKFSFDFPEPSVEFGGYRFGFLVFTRENVYGLDAALMVAEEAEDALTLAASGLVWAGGQAKAPGRLVAHFRQSGDAIEWDVTADMDQPIKSVTTVIRGIPRGKISSGGGRPFDPKDDELLYGYPFGAGDLFGGNTAWGMSTPFVAVEAGDADFRYLSSLDDRVRAKRFFFQPGETGYRVEAVFEAEGWLDQQRLAVPTWRLGRTTTLEAATEAHYAHLERAYGIPTWESRDDVPAWLRDQGLVLALHGMHYTGYAFNDFARMLEILQWAAPQFPAERTLVFLPAWDGRYYWNYPAYRADERLGGEAGLKRLVDQGHQLGYRFMPMFGMNAANRRQREFRNVADAATYRIDGDRFDLDWVDWDNDRHQEGWLSYMNLGVDSWREWLNARIVDTIERYGMDAYFLDISAGWMNNTQADMHEGTRRLVAELRGTHPDVLACGEFHYDALLGFIPLFHVYSPQATKYARFFAHLSHPAPGRGSSGVHESGFGTFDAATLGMGQGSGGGPIPTITVVDDTFTTYKDQFAAALARAKQIGGIP